MIRKVYLIKRGEGFKGRYGQVSFERARIFGRKSDASNSINQYKRTDDSLTEAYLVTPDELEKIKQWDEFQKGFKEATERILAEKLKPRGGLVHRCPDHRYYGDEADFVDHYNKD